MLRILKKQNSEIMHQAWVLKHFNNTFTIYFEKKGGEDNFTKIVVVIETPILVFQRKHFSQIPEKVPFVLGGDWNFPL